MSDKMPALSEPLRFKDARVTGELYTADQLRAVQLAAFDAGLEAAAEMVWPEQLKVWTTEEAETLRLAEARAQQRGKGHYETLFAIVAAALKNHAAAIRAMKEKQS